MDIDPKDLANVAVVVQPGTVALDLAVPIQVFGRWPEHLAAANPYTLAVAGAGPIDGPLVPRDLQPLERIASAGTVIVPGVDDPSVPPDPALVEQLRAAYARGSRMVSICTGAFALAAAGILDGRAATTHWRWAGLLRDRHPAVQVREAELYVTDTGVYTSAGVLAGTDLCLHLLRTDLGQAAANDMARFLISPPHRDGGQAQFIEPMTPRGDPDIARLLAWIQLNLHEPLTLELISGHSLLSSRTLRRRFREATGTSVLNWVILQRVARARALLETTSLGVDEIAHRCGFGSAESLRVHFHAHTRTSPSHYRRTFGVTMPGATSGGS
ncbi:transcriptional regulator GlxA family with amidase domain [Actinoplanes lutulentus]|uniref:Transcriptional regulator GlxA family with amidase domain n=1 Tax=Actinoplanes lutulentus TaxID=1287878 RepID=A0A327Z8Z6_9ACTN|nr:helix-turn-helix domain-containing protein [Actinoplanes lutulentus]MBB2946940.1 transcriptional regulator GlxA family with amidase domain [Actinoplanes lutulentus]RAK30442.1 transcriptional regulator GlxA family with amidase domain [Actinoplanes lutulentus]